MHKKKVFCCFVFKVEITKRCSSLFCNEAYYVDREGTRNLIGTSGGRGGRGVGRLSLFPWCQYLDRLIFLVIFLSRFLVSLKGKFTFFLHSFVPPTNILKLLRIPRSLTEVLIHMRGPIVTGKLWDLKTAVFFGYTPQGPIKTKKYQY